MHCRNDRFGVSKAAKTSVFYCLITNIHLNPRQRLGIGNLAAHHVHRLAVLDSVANGGRACDFTSSWLLAIAWSQCPCPFPMTACASPRSQSPRNPASTRIFSSLRCTKEYQCAPVADCYTAGSGHLEVELLVAIAVVLEYLIRHLLHRILAVSMVQHSVDKHCASDIWQPAAQT